VVTATQAALWYALRVVDVTTPIAGYGRLLAEREAP
jgi:maleate cis-trans isomerase